MSTEGALRSQRGPWLAQACAWAVVLCTLSATASCSGAWVNERTVSLGPPLRTTRTALLADSTRRQVVATVEGLGVTLKTRQWQHCVVEHVEQRTQTVHQIRRAAPWLWTAWATVAAASGGLLIAAQPTDDARLQLAGGAMASASAAAFLALMAVHGQHRKSAEPDRVTVLDSQLQRCAELVWPGVGLEVHGARGMIAVTTGADGEASLDLQQLDDVQFPYRVPLALATCEGCEAVALAPDATAAATLVTARAALDDFATWLLVHPLHPLQAQVAAARDSEVTRQRQLQDAALQSAQRFLANDDLVGAAIHLRRCQQVSRLPSPRCDALLRDVEDRFVTAQLALGRRAATACAVEMAEQALYRCRLMDPTRPACVELQLAVSEARACTVPPPPPPPAVKPPRPPRRKRALR